MLSQGKKITLVVLTAGSHVVDRRPCRGTPGRDDTPRDRNNLDAINLIKSLRRSAEFKQPQFDSVQERSLPWGASHTVVVVTFKADHVQQMR